LPKRFDNRASEDYIEGLNSSTSISRSDDRWFI
jgi:hypothetical protein